MNRILYVRNLPYTITAEELYAIFGKYGAVFQIRLGEKDKDTRGTAFVVYEVCEQVTGFHVSSSFLFVPSLTTMLLS